MAISETQLETWSHQGAIATAKNTSDSVRNALNQYSNWPDEIEYEVYLQGSYKNDTNIRGDMDVDLIVQLNSTFYSNLTEDQKRSLGLTPASYGWSKFRLDILAALIDYYGSTDVTEGNKSIKLREGSNRLPADVVVGTQYRRYLSVNLNDYVEGITFWTRNENRQTINYPKVHYRNGIIKHQGTNNWFKPSVRIFKNIRNAINDGAPSYFLECLIYNVPNSEFGRTYQHSFCNIINWLYENDLTELICQNEQLKLFGSTPEQWSVYEARNFVNRAISLWNNS
jgi:hypothetical protein